MAKAATKANSSKPSANRAKARGVAPSRDRGHSGATQDVAKTDKPSRRRAVAGEIRARRDLIETALQMSRSGLSPGRSGNVSLRWDGGMRTLHRQTLSMCGPTADGPRDSSSRRASGSFIWPR